MEGGWEGRQGEREVGDGRAGWKEGGQERREGVRGWRVEGEGGWGGREGHEMEPGRSRVTS